MEAASRVQVAGKPADLPDPPVAGPFGPVGPREGSPGGSRERGTGIMANPQRLNVLVVDPELGARQALK